MATKAIPRDGSYARTAGDHQGVLCNQNGTNHQNGLYTEWNLKRIAVKLKSIKYIRYFRIHTWYTFCGFEAVRD